MRRTNNNRNTVRYYPHKTKSFKEISDKQMINDYHHFKTNIGMKTRDI